MIHYMIYRSHTELMPSDDAYRRILEQARGRNFMLGVTGYLHWEDGIIHQWIEGPAAGLSIVEQYILSDRNHQNTVVLDRGYGPEREFEGWSMAENKSEGNSLFAFIAASAVPSSNHAAYARNIMSFMKQQLV